MPILPESNPGRVRKWLCLILVCVSYLLAFAHRMSVVSFYDEIMVKYDVGYTQAGMLLTVFFLAYALFQIPSGVAADRMEARYLMLAGLALMGIGQFLFTQANSYPWLMAARFIMGMSGALMYSPGFKIIAANFSSRERGLSMGAMESAAGLGMLLTLTVLPVLSKIFSMETLFGILALTSVPLILAVIIIRPTGTTPTTSPVNPPRMHETPGSGGEKTIGRDSGAPGIAIVFQKKFLCLMGLSFFGLLGMYGLLGWFPTFMTDALGYTKPQSAGVMAVVTASITLTSPLGGKISDMVGKRVHIIIFGSILMCACFLYLLAGPSTLGLKIVAAIWGIGASWSMAPMLALASEIYGVGMAGSVVGVTNAVGQMASALSGFGYGMVLDTTGSFKWIWIVCIISLLIRSGLALAIGEASRHHTKIASIPIHGQAK